MVIRKLKQKKIVNARVVFRFVLLCIGTYLLIQLVSSIAERVSQTPQEHMKYTLGATLTFSGILEVDNNFPNYTHSIVIDNGTKIGLKSATINLNAYVDEYVELVGVVKKYFKITPVIEVTTLKLPNQGLILKENRYFFVYDLLYLDFSTQPQLSAMKSGADVSVLFNNQTVVDIERFSCSKIVKTRNCSYLITNYIQTNKDTFDSYRAYTFYKHSTGFWTVFDGVLYGYLFKNISDEMILDISNMFQIINKQFVVTNKMSQIQEFCQDAFSQIHTIDTMESSLTYVDPYLLTLDLKGTDMKKNPATCKISFDIRNDWEVVESFYNDEGLEQSK